MQVTEVSKVPATTFSESIATIIIQRLACYFFTSNTFLSLSVLYSLEHLIFSHRHNSAIPSINHRYASNWIRDFWDVSLHCWISGSWCSFEMTGPTYPVMRCHIPEDQILQLHCYGNLVIHRSTYCFDYKITEK